MAENAASGQSMREEHKNKDLHKSERNIPGQCVANPLPYPSLIPKKTFPFHRRPVTFSATALSRTHNHLRPHESCFELSILPRISPNISLVLAGGTAMRWPVAGITNLEARGSGGNMGEYVGKDQAQE